MVAITLDYFICLAEVLEFEEDFEADMGRKPTEEEITRIYTDIIKEQIAQGDFIEELNNAEIKIHIT